MTAALTESVVTREDDLPWVDIGVRPGYNQRYTSFYDEESGIGVRVGSLYAEPEFHSPRHRHTFQQVRYVVSGSMAYGPNVYSAGDCLYIPEGGLYGPIKPTESADGKNLHFVDMQFEGPSGLPYPHPDEVLKTQRALAEIGTFDDGMYIDADGNKEDAYEAIYKKVTGCGDVIPYQNPRLADIIVMKSSAYPWCSYKGNDDIQVRHLGYVYETGPNIKRVHLEPGAVLPAAAQNFQQVRFVLEGELECDGNDVSAISYLFTPPNAPTLECRAKTAVELLVVQWTKPGKEPPAFCEL